MLVSLQNKLYTIWKAEGESEEFKKLDAIKHSINVRLDFVRSKVLNSMDIYSERDNGYNLLVENVSEEEFKYMVYATFRGNSRLLEDGRITDTVRSYIESILTELEDTEVFEEYKLYEHPELWCTLLCLVKNRGYISYND